MWLSPLRHYMTKYEEGGVLWVESWIQVEAFGRCWCFSRRRLQIGGEPLSDEEAHPCGEDETGCVA